MSSPFCVLLPAGSVLVPLLPLETLPVQCSVLLLMLGISCPSSPRETLVVLPLAFLVAVAVSKGNIEGTASSLSDL